MKVDGRVIPVLLLVNIHVHGSTWAVVLSVPRLTMFYDYLGRRRCGGWFSGGGSHRRRSLLTSGDPERDTGENEPRKECSSVLFHVVDSSVGEEGRCKAVCNFTLSPLELTHRWIIAWRSAFAGSKDSETPATAYGQRSCSSRRCSIGICLDGLGEGPLHFRHTPATRGGSPRRRICSTLREATCREKCYTN